VNYVIAINKDTYDLFNVDQKILNVKIKFQKRLFRAVQPIYPKIVYRIVNKNLIRKFRAKLFNKLNFIENL